MMSDDSAATDRDELIERLQRAITRLEERAAQSDVGMIERARLGGKIEGVKLALSYVRAALAPLPETLESEETE